MKKRILKPDFDFRIKLVMISFYFSVFVLFLGNISNIVPFTSALEIKLGFNFLFNLEVFLLLLYCDFKTKLFSTIN